MKYIDRIVINTIVHYLKQALLFIIAQNQIFVIKIYAAAPAPVAPPARIILEP
jgi:hypothetical protein